MILYTLLLLFVSICLFFYWYITTILSCFKKNDIPHIKFPSISVIIRDILADKKPTVDEFVESYWILKPHKVGGMFIYYKPIYMLCDPEISKNILIKDFTFFPDRGTPDNTKDEPLNNHLANIRGEKWKNLRIKLTPTFSSGKMKMMFPLIKTCSANLAQVLEKSANEETDVNDLCARFTADVIATCAFGFEINSLENHKSEFREICKTMGNSRIKTTIRILFPNIPSLIIKLFNLHFFTKKAEQYFFSLVRDTVEYREKNKVIRHDFMDLLIGLKNNTDINKFQDQLDAKDFKKLLAELGSTNVKNNVEMTTELLVAQSFAFLTAGSETTSAAICFVLLELALNLEIQNKVRKEINEILKNNRNELTYDVMQKMKYVDMVIAETLRKHPPVAAILRRCNGDYNIPGTKITLKRNDIIMIPAIGFHMDNEYFEKPDEFYPEHFTDEAIAARPSFSYLPFGEGPRVCIAARFAKLEIKTALIHVIKGFECTISPKMKKPFSFVLNGLTSVDGGVWLKFKKIDDC